MEIQTIHDFVKLISEAQKRPINNIQKSFEDYSMGFITPNEHLEYCLQVSSSTFVEQKKLIDQAMESLKESKEFLKGACASHYIFII